MFNSLLENLLKFASSNYTLFAGAATLLVVFLIISLFIGKKKKKEKVVVMDEDEEYLVEQINMHLKFFEEADDNAQMIFKEKTQELESTNNFEQIGELNEFIDYYNKIVRKFDKLYSFYSEKEYSGKEERTTSFQEYIDKLEKLTETLKKLQRKLSRITFVKTEEEFAEESTSSAAEETKEATPKYTYFKGTESKEELKKKYLLLVKIYHPDSVTGDEERFIEIRKEYEELSGMAG